MIQINAHEFIHACIAYFPQDRKRPNLKDFYNYYRNTHSPADRPCRSNKLPRKLQKLLKERPGADLDIRSVLSDNSIRDLPEGWVDVRRKPVILDTPLRDLLEMPVKTFILTLLEAVKNDT